MTFSKIFGNRILFVITNDRSDSGIVLIRNPDLIQEFVTHGMPVRRQRIVLSVDIRFYPEHETTVTTSDPTFITPAVKAMLRRKNV